MKITFYRSAFCPRCYFARKSLHELFRNRNNVEIEEIDVVLHPLRAAADGIRIFPAIRVNQRILQGFFLTKGMILKFFNASSSLPAGKNDLQQA